MTWATGWGASEAVSAAELTKGVGAIGKVVPGSNVATMTVSSIPSVYAALLAICFCRSDNASSSVPFYWRLNGDTGANYYYGRLQASSTLLVGNAGAASTVIYAGNMPAATAAAGWHMVSGIFIPNYAGTVGHKSVLTFSGGGENTGENHERGGGRWASTAAVTSVVAVCGTGNFVAGATRLVVYGMGG